MWVVGCWFIGVCLCACVSLDIGLSPSGRGLFQGGNQLIGRGTADGEVHLLHSASSTAEHGSLRELTALMILRFDLFFFSFSRTAHIHTSDRIYSGCKSTSLS